MNGFIEINSLNQKMPFYFHENMLTIYNHNTISMETPTDLGIKSSHNYLIGEDLASRDKVIFFVDNTPFSCQFGSILSSTTISVYYYIDKIKTNMSFSISSLDMSFPELNYFFDISAGINHEIDYENGTQMVETFPYNDSKACFSFLINNKDITGEIGIIQQPQIYPITPFKLSSKMVFRFDSTSDINLLTGIYGVIKRLFCFLCYRRSVQINEVKLYRLNDSNKKIPMGTFHPLFNECDLVENENIIKQSVKFDILKKYFSELIQAFADNKIYYEHFPETESDAHKITVARTILTTAAFEWIFYQSYNDIPLSKYRQDVRQDVLCALEKLHTNNTYNSKKKKEIKFYQKVISDLDINLSKKIQTALKDCHSILEPFMSRLYQINEMEAESFTQIADDLQYQRNAYAHGEIDRELKENIVLDVIILQWLNYCLVLKQIGYDDTDIFNAINHIFKIGLRDKSRGDEQ